MIKASANPIYQQSISQIRLME